MTPLSQRPAMQNVKEKAGRAKTFIIEKSKYVWMNHRKKTVFFTVLAIFIIVLVIATPPKNTSADQYTVKTQNIVDQVVLSGRTESINSVDLGFADSGRVQRVYVTEGQKVKKGQVLAELEMGDLSAQLTSAKAELVIAQANLQTINREQDARVETAKRNLFGNLEAFPDNVYSAVGAPTISGSYTGDTAGSYTLEVYSSAADTGFSIRYTGLESGTTEFTTTSRVALGNRGLFIQFPETTYKYAHTKWVIPVPNNRSSEYATLKNAYDTAVAARNVAIGNANDNAALLQARVDQARASINQIYSAMGRRRINAPFSGTVSSVGLKEGESTIGISKDTSPGVSMLATDQYKVVIKVPEIDVARVSANIPVSISLDAYGPDKAFPGTLTTINPAETIVDGVPVYEGTVLFTEKNDMIRSGMTSTVTIVVGNKENVVAVPGSYIREDKVARKSFVSVINLTDPKKKAEEREVKTGIRGSDGVTEIISGLEKDEVIVPEKK